jgi:hypothetical protein
MQPTDICGDFHCSACGLRWWIEDHAEVWRDNGELRCDCGTPIVRWNGSRTYSKIPMFREPTVTTADLATEHCPIPAGATITVSHHQTTEGLRPPTTYRHISYEGNNLRVREEDLYMAAPR